MSTTNLKDLAERTAWTFVQAFGGTMTGDGIFDLGIGPPKAAAVAGIGAVITLLTVVARQRLSELDTRQRPVRADDGHADMPTVIVACLVAVAVVVILLVTVGDDLVNSGT